MNINPEISVVMTVFNGEKFIREAVDSILGQTFTDFEFIIVDNASTDATKRIISSYMEKRIRLIENKENLGQTKALNIGIKHSKGDFIARMDADDISSSERLALQHRYLTENESVAVVGSWHEEIDESGRHIKYFKMPTDPSEIKYYLISPGELAYFCVSHPTVLMRRNVLFDVGLYNEDYLAQDYDLWVRIVRKHKIANVDRFLLKHRVSSMQQTKKFQKDIDSECQKIVMSNIQYYLPLIESRDLMPLARMLLYQPQQSREDGLKVLNIFNNFFNVYLDDRDKNGLFKKAQDKIEVLYLLQLMKTNPVFSFRKFFSLICKNPDILAEGKFYRKIIRAMIF